MNATSNSSAFRSVAVVAKRSSEEAVATAGEVAQWLARRGLELKLDPAVLGHLDGGAGTEFVPEEGADLVVVLGGDGTLLSVARRLPSGTPVLGVNLGTLGFLAEIGRSELYPALLEILAGRHDLEQRSLLRVELVRADGETERFRVVNDAVIAKSALSRILDLDLSVDGRLVASYRSDGLIISTPTGSTAYNLSAGGPILNPTLPVCVLTPICPHAFSLRPIVVPDSSRIEVTLVTGSEEVYLTLDGQEGAKLSFRDTVRVGRSDVVVNLVRTSGRTFYDSLRDKLHWGR